MQAFDELDISEEQATSSMMTPRSSTNGSFRNDTGAAGGSNGRAEISPVVLGCHLLDFWINLCVCHSLIVEEAEDEGPPIFQASSCYIALPGVIGRFNVMAFAAREDAYYIDLYLLLAMARLCI